MNILCLQGVVLPAPWAAEEDQAHHRPRAGQGAQVVRGEGAGRRQNKVKVFKIVEC